MKKVLFICFLVAAISASSQTKTYIGLKAGGHVNSVFFEHTIFGFNSKFGVQPGVNAGIQIKHFPKKREAFLNSGIQGGVNFMQKGWSQVFTDTGLPNYHVSMDYIEIPIEGIGYFGNKNKYFIGMGMFVEMLINSEVDASPVGLTTIDFATYVPERDREVGYGGRIIAGTFRDFGFGSIHLEGFLSYSFSNFIDAGDLSDDQVPDISNLYSVGISIGYFVSFGKLKITE